MEEMIVKEEKHELSPFADSQSVCYIAAGATELPRQTDGLYDCSRYGESNGRIPYDGHAESVCCKRQAYMEWTGLYEYDPGEYRI